MKYLKNLKNSAFKVSLADCDYVADMSNECTGNPCGSHGTCNDKVKSYTCTCNEGWTGTTCTEGNRTVTLRSTFWKAGNCTTWDIDIGL